MTKTRLVRYLEIGVLALFIYMPFHVFLSQWLSTYTGGLEVWKGAHNVVAFCLAASLLTLVYLEKRQTKLLKTLLVLVGLYALLHVTLFFATDQPVGTGLLATVYNLRLFVYLFIGYCLVLLLPKKQLFKRYTKILIVLSTLVCLVALLQWLLPKDIMTHFGYAVERGVKPNFFIDDKPDFPRVFSTLRDPNSLGAFLILPIVILVSYLTDFWKTGKRTLIAGLFMLHVLVLFSTFSRSTLLATILAVGCFVALKFRKVLFGYKKQIIAGAVILLIVGAGIFWINRDSYVVQNVVLHADDSTVLADPNELRVELYQKGLEGVAEEPLGNGPGTAGLVSTRLPDGLLTENYYIQIAYEVGVIGLVLFGYIMFILLRPVWKSRSHTEAQILLATFTGLAFASLLFHTPANEAVALSYFLLLGIFLPSSTKA